MASGLLDAWEIALGDLSEHQLKFGLKVAIQMGGEHPPSAGEFRKACLGTDRKALEARAAAAFDAADQLARARGLAASVRELNDPLITLAIGQLGGWSQFCTRVDEWQRRTFINQYVVAAENPQLEVVAKLSHAGRPLGAISEVRQQLAATLNTPPPLRNTGGQIRSPQPSDERRFQAEEPAVSAARLKREKQPAIPF